MANVQSIARILDCEVRFTDTEDGEITGYATKFNVVDSYRTSFAPDAFSWSGRLPLLWHHNPADVVGSIRSITPDNDGLKIIGRLNLDVAKAREVRSMLKAGDIDGLSIGFRTLKDEGRSGGIRHITKAQLKEVSFVTFPAVPGSQVTAVRSSSSDLAGFVSAIRRASASMKG